MLRASAVLLLALTLLGGCERKLRARDREAREAEAKAEAQAREAARLAALPPPEEPPVELLRIPNSGLPCDVDDVFARKCRRCHTIPTRHGAPFVFLTWDDTRQDRMGQPLFNVIGRAVQTGFMPYRLQANPPVLPLTDEEKKIILDWVAAGAPRGDCAPSGSAGGSAPTTPSQVRQPNSSGKAGAKVPAAAAKN